MFNKVRLKDVLVKYKQDLASAWWDDEKFKWVAVKCFRDNWDVNAVDFAEMLARSLAKTSGLLTSKTYYPARMITKFAKAVPEEVRAMFIALFDESKGLYERIDAFKDRSNELLKKYGSSNDNQHFQTENAISTYLWLRYPDKYYIYKFNEIKTVAGELESDHRFKQGAYADNIGNFYKFYNEICKELKRDTELIELLNRRFTDDCYHDPELKTLTIDVGFYINKRISQKNSEWFPTDYDPGLSADDWIGLLGNREVFTTGSLEIMKRMKDHGGMATCTQLSVKYGETKNFYNSGSVALARRVAEKTGCPVMEREDESSRWWTILYIGRSAGEDEEGSYVWKLRDELAAALDKVDLSGVKLYAESSGKEAPPLSVSAIEPYTKDDFLREVYMSEARYENLAAVLRNKKNIILQGAPGVGKTFAAKRLAYSMMGVMDDSHIEFVQFHQNYSYEDLVMGYKPSESSFELKYGIFYRFCKMADEQPNDDFFFIIDEINRGNMSKIFGELLMLIERDYRGTEITLAYEEKPFYVPKNIFIIGMMNTADRSLAMIDYALRRRFSFFEMEPGFDSEGFIRHQNSFDNEILNELVSKIKELNKEIAQDRSLGKGFCIGHSYFCGGDICTEERLREIVEYDILPMLSEYWFDDAAKLQRWENILRGVFQ